MSFYLKLSSINTVTQPDTHKKLTEGRPAVKQLRALFDEAKISKSRDPKSVYESDPIFYTNHRLDPFRTRLNNPRKEYPDVCDTLY